MTHTSQSKSFDTTLSHNGGGWSTGNGNIEVVNFNNGGWSTGNGNIEVVNF